MKKLKTVTNGNAIITNGIANNNIGMDENISFIGASSDMLVVDLSKTNKNEKLR